MSDTQPTISRALVMVAHPDDIEFGAAGTIALWRDAGIDVTFCIVTDGAAGSNARGVNYAELVKQRQQEQLAAAACLGVEDVRFLGYSDGTLQPTIELRRDLTRLIRQVRPDRVMITDPTTILFGSGDNSYINHPDHRAVAEAALYAIFPSAGARPIFPELLDEGLEPWKVNEVWMMLSEHPDTVVDVSSVQARKEQALLCHQSQLTERHIEFVRLFGVEIGSRIGAAYGEDFRVMRFYQSVPAASEASS